MSRIVAMLIGVAALAAPAPAQALSPAEAAIDNYIAAQALGEACARWRLDEARAALRFSAARIEPHDVREGGRHHDYFRRKAQSFKIMVAQMTPDLACDTAEMFFGPQGTVQPDWMKRR